MRADIFIVGQGLAGTLLGWELERAGIPFAIADAGHGEAASRVAAGIINPITGQRLVKSWQVESLLPRARQAYRELESVLGVPLWREMRVRRLFADDRERKILADRQARGELGAFAGEVDHAGFWIEGAGRIDLPTLLRAARARWQANGVLREQRVEWSTVLDEHDVVVDCSGAAGSLFDFVPWEFSKGEILTIKVENLDPGVILNRGHWVLPIGDDTAKVGATHEPGRKDRVPTAAARTLLEKSAAIMLGREFEITGQEAGVRVNLPDRRPVAGRHPLRPRLGLLNGLGAKGALLAPWLAQQWVNHLTEGVPFEPAVDVARFWQRRSSQTLSS